VRNVAGAAGTEFAAEAGLRVAKLDGLLDAERWPALRTAVAGLPEQMRDCLTMRLYHQLSYAEIAAAKKISIETVEAHLVRASQKRRQSLADFALEDLEE